MMYFKSNLLKPSNLEMILKFNVRRILIKSIFQPLQGRIILSLPSIEVLAEAAATPNRRGAVLHVLETTVLAWIKQIKVCKLL